jgi:hypothetical protein
MRTYLYAFVFSYLTKKAQGLTLCLSNRDMKTYAFFTAKRRYAPKPISAKPAAMAKA